MYNTRSTTILTINFSKIPKINLAHSTLRNASIKSLAKPPINYHHPTHSSKPIFYIDPETKKAFLIIVAKSFNTSDLIINKFDIEANEYHTINIGGGVDRDFSNYVYFIDPKSNYLYIIDTICKFQNTFVCNLTTGKYTQSSRTWPSFNVSVPHVHSIKNKIHFLRSNHYTKQSYHHVIDLETGGYTNLDNNADTVSADCSDAAYHSSSSPHSVYLPLMDKMIIFGHSKGIWELNDASKDSMESKWTLTDIETPDILCFSSTNCAFVVGFDSFVFLFAQKKNYCLDVFNKKWYKLTARQFKFFCCRQRL